MNSSPECKSKLIDRTYSIYVDISLPDTHQFYKQTTASWITFISAVIVMHLGLVILLWIASSSKYDRVDEDLFIEFSDSGGQRSAFFVMEALPGVSVDQSIETYPTQSLHEPIEQLELVPQLETLPQLETPSQFDPPIVLNTKPVHSAQPVQAIKKHSIISQPTTPKKSSDQPSSEHKNTSIINRDSGLSEESSTSTQNTPKLVKSMKPRYPSESIRLRQEGRVVVNIEVLESGSVGQATLVKSSGFNALDQSALETIKNWQYSNLGTGGPPIRQWVRASIVFELKNR